MKKKRRNKKLGTGGDEVKLRYGRMKRSGRIKRKKAREKEKDENEKGSKKRR